MKKRTLSLLLALCMMIGMMPFMAPRTEAFDLLSIFDAAGPIVRGAINASEQAKKENWGFGEALAGTFKSIGKEFLDLGDDDKKEPASTIIVNEVDLSEVELELANIQSTLNTQNVTLTQIKDSIKSNNDAVTKQLNDLKSQIADSTLQLQYYTYLSKYFEFHNEFYEAVSYYDKALTTLYSSNPSPMNIKNTFDQFYSLANVQYTGNYYSAIESLGKFLRGEYVTPENGSVIDILCKYYELAGYSKSETAATVKNFIGNTYYTYCLATYYYLSIALFQNTYLEDNNLEDYTSDLGIMKNKVQIEADVKTILESFANTTAHVFYDLNNHFSSLGTVNVTYYKAGVNYVSRTITDNKMDVEPVSAVTMPSTDTLLTSYLGEDFVAMFGGMCEYTYTSSSNAATVNANKIYFDNMKDGGSAVVTMNCTVGDISVPLSTYTFNGKNGKFAGGYGTYDYPYIIMTKEHFNSFANGASIESPVVSLNADLDYGGATISGVKYAFKGTFLGNGHKISNFKIESGGYDNCYGLFSVVENGGIISDLTVANATIQPNSTESSMFRVGSIAGKLDYGKIYRCEAVSVSVAYIADSRGGAYVGGLVGEVTNRATLTECIAYDCTPALGYNSTSGALGGLVGRISNLGEVSYCGREEGFILQTNNNNANNNAGGLIGEVIRGTLNYCWNYKTVDATTDQYTNYATSSRHGSFIGYIETLWSTGNVLYTGDGAKHTLVNFVTVGTLRRGDALQYYEAKDLTKSKINLTGNWCFSNVSGYGNPVRLGTFKAISINTDNVQTVFKYGEPLTFAGLEVNITLNGSRISGGPYGRAYGGYSVSSDYNAEKAGTYTVTVSSGSMKKSYQVTVLPKAHTFKQVLEPSSCTTAGSVYYICQDADCNETFDRQTLPARGHMTTHYDSIDADCNGTSQREYWHCTVCGKYYLDEDCTKESSKANLNFAGTKHNYTTPEYSWVKGDDGMYTCTASAYCQNENCPLHPKSNPLSEVGSMHAYSTNPPSQTTDGKMTFVAEFTNPLFTTQEKDDIIPATHPKHTFADPVYTWTENADGTYSCTATLACTLENCYEYPASKPLTEVASVSADIKEATCKLTGKTVYTATFKDSHFTTQTKEIVLPTIECPSKSFKDVKKGSWFHAATDFVVSRGLMNGTSATAFEPDTNMSRAMLVTVLWRMEGSPKPNGKTPFTDLKQSWYRDAVAWAYENEIVKGITDTTFEPDGNVIREQLAAIFYRYAQYRGIDVSARADLTNFKDSSKIRAYAKDSASWAYAAGLITGQPSGDFDPRGSATRAQVATILMRFIGTYN